MEDSPKRRDLEERTFRFGESIRTSVKQLQKTISNAEDVRQLVRASGSVAANWIEADGGTRTDADFFFDYLEERISVFGFEN